MTNEELLVKLDSIGVGEGETLVRFLGDVDRFGAGLIRYLARLGKDDARAHLSEAQADVKEATAVGWDELADELVASGQVAQPNTGEPGEPAADPNDQGVAVTDPVPDGEAP